MFCVLDLETEMHASANWRSSSLEIEGLAETQTIKQHQGDEGEIAKGAKALPELSDFFGRERHDDALGFFEPELGGNYAMRVTVLV